MQVSSTSSGRAIDLCGEKAIGALNLQGTNKNGEGSRHEEAGKLVELGRSLTEEVILE